MTPKELFSMINSIIRVEPVTEKECVIQEKKCLELIQQAKEEWELEGYKKGWDDCEKME